MIGNVHSGGGSPGWSRSPWMPFRKSQTLASLRNRLRPPSPNHPGSNQRTTGPQVGPIFSTLTSCEASKYWPKSQNTSWVVGVGWASRRIKPYNPDFSIATINEPPSVLMRNATILKPYHPDFLLLRESGRPRARPSLANPPTMYVSNHPRRGAYGGADHEAGPGDAGGGAEDTRQGPGRRGEA